MHYLYATIEPYKIKPGPYFVYKEVFQSLVVKTLPCSGCFIACMSAHFPIVKLGYVDRMTHHGMVPNGIIDPIEFQLTSLRGIEVLACSFDTDFNYGLF